MDLMVREQGLSIAQVCRDMDLVESAVRRWVEQVEAEQTTASGLVIPDTAKEKPQQGTVLAVGPGRWSDTAGKYFPLDLKVGDVVLYSKYGGTEVTHKGDDLLILTSRDVLAIVSK
mgnify:CR=1 FL=1